MTRAANAHDDPPNAFVAAYQTGRLLNQIDWHLQQAWLLPAIDWKQALPHDREVFSILTSLAPTLRPALATSAKMRLSEALLAQRDEWGRAFGSQWHMSAVEDQSISIRDALKRDDYCPLNRLLEASWQVELRWVSEFASGVLRLILAELDEQVQQALELGRWVDRGIHPRAAYRYMCRDTAPRPIEPSPPPGEDPFSNEYTELNTEKYHQELPPILYAITTETILPEYGWMDHVRHCCQALGLPESLLESIAKLQREANESAIETRVSCFVANLDQVVRDELADLTSQTIILAEDRTRAMTLHEAARLMGLGEDKKDKKAAERLRAYIKDGTIQCQSLSRQKHYFRISDFPIEVRRQIT